MKSTKIFDVDYYSNESGKKEWSHKYEERWINLS